MNNQIKVVLKNKVFWYMGSRYVTYALQFVTTLVIAIILGPFSYGIWSFLLLVINFFNIVDFGISNSLSVLLVQNKRNEMMYRTYITSSIVLVSTISLIIAAVYLWVMAVDIPLLDKYSANEYLPYVLFVVVAAYFNKIFQSIYRVRNKLFEVAFFQSVTPVLMFLFVIFFRKDSIWLLLGAYIIGSLASLIMFIARGDVRITSNISVRSLSTVAFKGGWLFLYNSAFYLIMYFMMLGVSSAYSVDEYGKFSFAHTLSNAVIMLIDSFSFIIFPKMIDRLKNNDKQYVRDTINIVRVNYTTAVHALVYLALPFFYLLCILVGKYADTGRAICLSALALLPYSNAFGLNTYLIANNKEKVLSLVSTVCLILNIILFNLLVYCLKVPYDVVFISIIISYTIYAISCAFITTKDINGKKHGFFSLLSYTFPLCQIIPYVISLVAVFVSFSIDKPAVLILPIIVFAVFNKSKVLNLFKMFKEITFRPQVVDM